MKNPSFHDILKLKLATDSTTPDSVSPYPENTSGTPTHPPYIDMADSTLDAITSLLSSSSIRFEPLTLAKSELKKSAAYRRREKVTVDGHLQRDQTKSARQQPKSSKWDEKSFAATELSVAARVGLMALNLDIETDPSVRLSVSKIKKAYRKKALDLHPDLNPSLATSDFSNLKEIYEYILAEAKKLTESCDT